MFVSIVKTDAFTDTYTDADIGLQVFTRHSFNVGDECPGFVGHDNHNHMRNLVITGAVFLGLNVLVLSHMIFTEYSTKTHNAGNFVPINGENDRKDEENLEVVYVESTHSDDSYL